jgi:uncharacterized membrane protein
MEKALPAPPARLDVVLYPNCSLGRVGFAVLMAAIALVSAAVGAGFMMIGAWPVAGFFGLDFLGLYIAFRVSYRQGDAFELLELTPIRLLFRKVSPKGEVKDWQFNPLWTRLDREVDDEFGLQKLALASRGQRVVIARDLSPPERETLAADFGRALSEVKRGY